MSDMADCASSWAFAKNPVPMWIEDKATSRFLAVNDSALRFYGYSREQFLAMSVAALEAPDSVGNSPAASHHRKADGTIVTVRLESTPVDGSSASLVAAIDVTPQREAERKLALRERYHEQLFETASDWYWEHDAKARITFISPNFEAVTGVSIAEMRGKRLADMPQIKFDPEKGLAALAEVRARRPFRDCLHSVALADGSLLWVGTSGIPMVDENGAFRGYCGVSKDVTAQIEAERVLRESEKWARQLFEVSADYYWETDAEFRYTYLSPAFERFLGVAPEQMIGLRMTEDPHVSIEPEMGKMVVSACIARESFRDFVYARKFPDGTTRWFKTSGMPNFDKDGAFKGYRGLGADITRHVEADQAARLAQNRLHDAVAHLTQPVVFYDAQGRAIAYNQAFTDLHRDPAKPGPVGQGVSFRALAEWQFCTGFYAEATEDEVVTLEVLLDHFQKGDERTYHLRDGRWMMVVYRRLPGEGTVGLWTDVTALKLAEEERRSLEAQLYHSQRLEALGTLVGGTAHEINNALVPVIALTKMVASHMPEESRERRSLNTVMLGAQRSRDLVQKILAFGRKEEHRHASVDVGAVLRDALQLMRATVPTSIRFAEEIAAVPPVAGDPNQLHQVIVNLVNNAGHAIGEAHGTITVGLRAEADGTMLRLWVADTGCGMDEATKAKIFQPFFTTKEVGKGTGLGLSVVQGIIKEHGGRIEVDSAPGRGTRFDIVLPAQTAKTAGAAA
jgi:PAS domain S-box-containing protein